ncbi:GyrI-like domain-containing protein [Pseudoflavitalea sp. X16]|uniref:GyrI-like domain-containing protein n=1 Tax=Paraflavitalea devenefica TaxID=2716334 RepID=UPI0014229D3D|nr:GyrI-like domain-containing protein [Paraflavitalea devenefica]NII24805.1 GyrI-like domain-containing protein [Paraflavitalea devenefica]
MKKIVAGILVVLLVLFLLSYFVLPARPRALATVYTQATTTSTQLFLLDENKWAAWWPADSAGSPSPHSFVYAGDTFRIGKKLYPVFSVTIQPPGGDPLTTLLSIIPLNRDSTSVTWEYVSPGSLNPLTRIKHSRQTKRLQENMKAILSSLQRFLHDDKNIYGITVVEQVVKDTLLVTTKATFPDTPAVASVYDLIHSLRSYVAAEGATATNYPMMHTHRTYNKTVEVMVALPVNKVLANQNGISFKRMPPGNILVTHVTGGPGMIRQTFQQLELYMRDHQRESPAVPFELMETDRLQEPDTAKWVTGIYYPVF